MKKGGLPGKAALSNRRKPGSDDQARGGSGIRASVNSFSSTGMPLA
jgi:hypothetical protein